MKLFLTSDVLQKQNLNAWHASVVRIPRIRQLIFACALVFGTAAAPALAQAQTPSPQPTPSGAAFSGYPMDNIPWDQRSPQDKIFKASYEDLNTFKHQTTYYADPFIWIYSVAFADKFRMPRQWIDSGLKGALALAWRMTTTGKSMCGYGRNPNSCWPTLTCQLDVYFDNQTPLPWNFTDVVRDNMIDGQTSDSYLPRLTPNSKWWRYIDGVNVPSQKGPVLPQAQLEMRYLRGGALNAGVLRLWLFDREYEPGVVLLSYKEACPDYDGEGSAVIRYHTQSELTRTRGFKPQSVHAVEIPEAYVKKIRAIYLAQKKPNEEVTKRLYEEFLRSRSAVSSGDGHQK